MKLLISACLMGYATRYDGRDNLVQDIDELINLVQLIPICPEVQGGLPTPRPPCEQRGSTIISNRGEEMTEYFERGAQEALGIAKRFSCQMALLKERSPSCGSNGIYDGTFTKTVIPGKGVCARVLEESGIRVYGESEIGQLLKDLKEEQSV